MRHGTRYPLVAMVTEEVDEGARAIITKMGCIVREVPRLDVKVDEVRNETLTPGRACVFALRERLDQTARV